VIGELLAVLLDAGATRADAAAAAAILDGGGSVRDAADALGFTVPTFRTPAAVTAEAVSAARETGR